MAHLGNQGSFLHDFPLALRSIQFLALGSMTAYCENTFTASIHAGKALQEAPAPLLAKQWKRMTGSIYNVKKWVAPMATICASYLIYREPEWTRPKVFMTAATALFAATAWPYTYIVMGPTVQKLEDKARSFANATLTDAKAEAGVPREETTHALVDVWKAQNLWRCTITTVSCVLLTWAFIEQKGIE